MPYEVATGISKSTPSAGGRDSTTAPAQHSDRLKIQQIQQSLKVPTTGKFDDATQAALLDFVKPGSMSNLDKTEQSILAGLQALNLPTRMDPDNPADPALIHEIWTIIRGGGAPQAHEPEEVGVRLLDVHAVNMNGKTISVQPLPLPLMFRSDADMDRVIKTFIVLPYYQQTPNSPVPSSYSDFKSADVVAAINGLIPVLPAAFAEVLQEHPDWKLIIERTEASLQARLMSLAQTHSTSMDQAKSQMPWGDFVDQNFPFLHTLAPDSRNYFKNVVYSLLKAQQHLDSTGRTVTFQTQTDIDAFKSGSWYVIRGLLKQQGWTDAQIGEVNLDLSGQRLQQPPTSQPPQPVPPQGASAPPVPGTQQHPG